MSDKNLLEAYALLRSVTPFEFDCGKLCGASCCNGDENTGMILFHGESEMFSGDEGFKIKSNGENDVLICFGKCDRQKRPLSCRFYPFYPLIHERGGRIRFDVVHDIRGAASCPAVYKGLKPKAAFKRAVKRAALCLARDAENLKILRETAEMLRDLTKLRQSLNGGRGSSHPVRLTCRFCAPSYRDGFRQV